MFSLSQNDMQVIKGFLLALLMVVLVAFIGASLADAETPKPSKEDYQNLEDIKDNQKIIEKNRAAHEAFMQAKGWNEEEVRQLNANGWNVNWETMTLVPFNRSATGEQANLDKLARAVAVAETSGCSDGTAVSRNNCHGIMCWPKTGREPCWFKSHGESFAAFKKVWTKKTLPYGGRVPDIELARVYTGNDNPDTWLCNVHRSYYDIQIPDCHAYLRETFKDQYAAHFGGTI